MSQPQFKVTVTGDATYTNDVFHGIQYKKRESNYDVATLTFSDGNSTYWEDHFNVLDEIKVWTKASPSASWTTDPQFAGIIRQIIPTMNSRGWQPQLVCKGYGSLLEITNCNRDYGVESANPTYPQPYNILANMVADFVNKSFAGANTGWSLNNSYITDNFGTDIKYINNPYRSNLDLANIVCDLTSAIGAGTAGGHWIVYYDEGDANPIKFLFAKIGDHAAGFGSPETYWPDWWNTNEAGSTLVQGVDFNDYTINHKTEDFANKVVLITDFRRPAFDSIFTEGTGAGGATTLDWGVEAAWGVPPWTIELIDDDTAGYFMVGDSSLQFYLSGTGSRDAWYPSGQNAGWDIDKWGSPAHPPRLNFYARRDGGAADIISIRMHTNAANYFEAGHVSWGYPGFVFFTLGTTQDKFLHYSIPIGSYFQNVQAQSGPCWYVGLGAPVWSNINYIGFTFDGNNTSVWLDDMHFSGKIARCAKWSGTGVHHDYAINHVNEYQRVLISRNSMDDSCIASDDTGFAARIAYAELLRRMAMPKTVAFSTETEMNFALAGQKLHIHAEKQSGGTFRFDTPCRIVELQENLVDGGGRVFNVTATTDLLNSRPIGLPDKYAMWMENMFLNSKEAKNIRSGAEVDLLIPPIETDYGD